MRRRKSFIRAFKGEFGIQLAIIWCKTIPSNE